jgi:hypothetical protein
MNETTYTIKIKKEYASAILEDLKQVNAIEIMEEPIPELAKTRVAQTTCRNESKPRLTNF